MGGHICTRQRARHVSSFSEAMSSGLPALHAGRSLRMSRLSERSQLEWRNELSTLPEAHSMMYASSRIASAGLDSGSAAAQSRLAVVTLSAPPVELAGALCKAWCRGFGARLPCRVPPEVGGVVPAELKPRSDAWPFRPQRASARRAKRKRPNRIVTAFHVVVEPWPYRRVSNLGSPILILSGASAAY